MKGSLQPSHPAQLISEIWNLELTCFIVKMQRKPTLYMPVPLVQIPLPPSVPTPSLSRARICARAHTHTHTHRACMILTWVLQVCPWEQWALNQEHQQMCRLAPHPALLYSLLKVYSAAFVEGVGWVWLARRVLVAKQAYQPPVGCLVFLLEYQQALKFPVVATIRPSVLAGCPAAKRKLFKL